MVDSQQTMSEHTVVIEREFDAPRELVWNMFTDPDEVAKWWGPEHFTTPREKIEYDLKPGGVSRLTMVGPDGEEFPNNGHFGVVEPPARLSSIETEIPHPLMESAETMIEFFDLGDGRTKVVVTSRLIASDELPDMANAGWNSQFDKLVALLAARS